MIFCGLGLIKKKKRLIHYNTVRISQEDRKRNHHENETFSCYTVFVVKIDRIADTGKDSFMSSEEKITPEEFDKELEQLMQSDGKEKKKGGRKKKVLLAAAAVLILAAATGKIFGGGKNAVPAVETVSPVKKDIQNRLSVSGPVSGTDSVDVVSNIHAEVLEIPVQEGEKVTKGQVLAVLDDTDIKKEVEIAKNEYDLAVSSCAEKDKEAKNGYAKAVQDLKAAQANYDRTKALYDGGSASLVELENAENAKNDAARAKDSFTLENGTAVADASYRYQIEKARFDYEKSEKLLADTEIKSPIDGTVVRVNTKVGRFADKMENNEPLFIIENLDVLEMEIAVSEYAIGKVAVGQEAEVSADILDGKTAKGQVVSISPTGEEKGGGSTERVIPTKIRIMDENTKLIAGITARAEIVLEESKDALTVPVSAVFDKDGTSYVQAVNDGAVHWIPVTAGVESDIETELIPGEGESLNESSVLLASPGEMYSEGMAVMPIQK